MTVIPPPAHGEGTAQPAPGYSNALASRTGPEPQPLDPQAPAP